MGALLFIGAWVLLGAAVVFIAMSGGPRGARAALYGQSRRARRATAVIVGVVFLGMGVVIPAAVILGGDAGEAGAARIELTDAEERGRELFGRTCQQCHVLAAANAVGKVGPNLDEMRPPKGLVLNAIVEGRARGQGTMPAGLYTGRDAEDVAAFVAAVAGRE